MTDRIEIDFTANVREVIAGTDEIGDGLGTVEDAISEVEAGGKDLAEGLIRNFLDTARAAGRSADDIERVLVESYDVPADAARRMARTATTELERVETKADDLTQASGKVGDAFKDVGGIAKSALEGDAGGALDSLGSTLAGIASVVAPGVGTALGVVAAEGIGAISDELRTAQEETDQLKANFASLYQSATADGRTFIDQAQIQAESLKIIFDPDTSRYDQAKKDAIDLGLTVQEVIRAQAGSEADLNTVLERSTELETSRKALVSDTATLRSGPVEQAERQQLLNATELTKRYESLKAIQDQNAAKASEFLATESARTEEIQKANRALAETPQSVPTKLSVDDSELEEKVSRSRTVRVRLEGYTRTGQQIV